jgi:hypothetical protein
MWQWDVPVPSSTLSNHPLPIDIQNAYNQSLHVNKSNLAFTREALGVCSSESRVHSGQPSCLQMKDVLIGVWTSERTTKARFQAIYKSWFQEGSIVFLTSTATGPDLIATGAPDTYLGTTVKGHVGLIQMMELFPNKKFYGILGEDNFVHWPSLLAGLTETAYQQQETYGDDNFVVSETSMGNDQFHKNNRFYGGAGVFFSRQAAIKLRPRLTESLRDDLLAAQSMQHDMHLSAILTSPIYAESRLVNGDYLMSQPPCFYMLALGSGCGPDSWDQTPPAVFHYLSPHETVYMGKLARFAALPDFMHTPLPQPPRKKKKPFLCSTQSSACSAWNQCEDSLKCSSWLLATTWAGLLNKNHLPIPKTISKTKYIDALNSSSIGANATFRRSLENWARVNGQRFPAQCQHLNYVDQLESGTMQWDLRINFDSLLDLNGTMPDVVGFAELDAAPAEAIKERGVCKSNSVAFSGKGRLQVSDIVIGVWVGPSSNITKWVGYQEGSVVALSSQSADLSMLPQMLLSHPNKSFYGILKEDSFLHWPSLLAGLTESAHRQNEKFGNDNYIVSETEFDQNGIASQLHSRAGVFLTRNVFTIVSGFVTDQVNTALSDAPQLLDLLLSELRSTPVRLDSVDYLKSQPPCFYVLKLVSGLGPSTWHCTPPAVFNFVTYPEASHLAAVAISAAQLQKNQTASITPALHSSMSACAQANEGNACSLCSSHQKEVGCSNWNCNDSIDCISMLLAHSWKMV